MVTPGIQVTPDKELKFRCALMPPTTLNPNPPFPLDHSLCFGCLRLPHARRSQSSTYSLSYRAERVDGSYTLLSRAGGHSEGRQAVPPREGSSREARVVAETRTPWPLGGGITIPQSPVSFSPLPTNIWFFFVKPLHSTLALSKAFRVALSRDSSSWAHIHVATLCPNFAARHPDLQGLDH